MRRKFQRRKRNLGNRHHAEVHYCETVEEFAGLKLLRHKLTERTHY